MKKLNICLILFCTVIFGMVFSSEAANTPISEIHTSSFRVERNIVEIPS